MLIFDEHLLLCRTLHGERGALLALALTFGDRGTRPKIRLWVASFMADCLIRQNSTSLNKLPLNVLSEWIVMTITLYANIVSFTQCHDNAAQGGTNLFIFIFMKTSVEKVRYNKVKHFCRRHWWRRWSRTQWETLPVSGSNHCMLLPKLMKKWMLPDLTSKRAALLENLNTATVLLLSLKSHLRTRLLPGLSSCSIWQLVALRGEEWQVSLHFSHTSLLSLDLVQQHTETCLWHVEQPCGGFLWAEPSQAVWCFSMKEGMGSSWSGICREEGSKKIKREFWTQREGETGVKRRDSYRHKEKLNTDGHICTRHITDLRLALPSCQNEDPIKMKGRRLLPSVEHCSLPMRSLNTRLMLSLTLHCPDQVILHDTLQRNSHL